MTNSNFANIGLNTEASSNVAIKEEGYFTNAELNLIPGSMVDLRKNKISRIFKQFVISIFSLGV